MKPLYWIPVLTAALVLQGVHLPPSWAQQPSPQNRSTPTVSASVDFRLAQTHSAEGLAELELADGSLWLLGQPVLNRADLASVEPRRTVQGQAYVRFVLSETGTHKLTLLSQQYAGKLLVITINDELVAAPIIKGNMSEGVLDAVFPSEAQAVDAVHAIVG